MKKVKIEQAGRLVDVVVYPVSRGRSTKAKRSPAENPSRSARQTLNDLAAARRFRLLLACNFSDADIVATLTYSDKFLPINAGQANKLYLVPFINKLRPFMRSIGYELKYMYVTEGLHGDHRLHHHIVLPGLNGVRSIVRDLWFAGENVHFKCLGSGGIDAWAGYLTKEPRKTGRADRGDRMWTPSLYLRKPVVTEFKVDDDFYEFAPPSGAVVVFNETIRNDWFMAQYVSYRLPQDGQGVDNFGKV